MDPEFVQRARWWADHWLPVVSAFIALVVIYLWARSLAPTIMVASLVAAAVGKVGLDSALKAEEASLRQLESSFPGATREGLYRARLKTLVYAVVCKASASVCSVSSLLAVMHWYK